MENLELMLVLSLLKFRLDEKLTLSLPKEFTLSLPKGVLPGEHFGKLSASNQAQCKQSS